MSNNISYSGMCFGGGVSTPEGEEPYWVSNYEYLGSKSNPQFAYGNNGDISVTDKYSIMDFGQSEQTIDGTLYEYIIANATQFVAELEFLSDITMKKDLRIEGSAYIGDKRVLVDGDILENYSKGLAYTLSSDGKSYSVTGLGTCTDTDIVIPSTYEGKPVTSIGARAFYECTSLTSVEIGDSVTSIGDNAFRSCDSMTSVVIPDSVTSIGGGAFGQCTRLKSLKIPSSITSVSINMFNGCTSLMSITMPDSVMSIGRNAFQYCRSLTSIEIPEGVTSISENAFTGCSSLTIYCEATEKPEGWVATWNPDNRPVVWGYIIDFDGVNEAFNEINIKLSGDLTSTSITTGTLTIGETTINEELLKKLLTSANIEGLMGEYGEASF